ncbi:iron-containing alcohol dehydrogenase [Bacteroides sp. 519]|uniref:iron-containing alcohol dehydrogenase n=1 Tax=Bacteroides sp. 519 TaxID=2302937 RepID=UPI0013D2445A|nr:iron-containing alcohol dehydrogenase [Bacteroides sp. 519]NDV60085.1 iron-containing alcohol dehydrogenase [Bacteroides sp. 519]
MNNFIFQNPVKLIMGKGMIAELANEIPTGKRIMVTFGGGSVKKNNVYNQVVEALKDFYTVEFWGIEANPTIETLRKAIALGKEEKIDFLVAVGGGSVIDGTKLISAGILYNGDAWDLVLAGKEMNTIPLATVLTLPATGSEMNQGAVISNMATKEKFAFYSNFPVFSILDPETTFTLPDNQIANGLTDTFVHVMEQYLTVPAVSRLMDRWAEGILQTVVEIAPLIKKDKHNYDLMAEFMLSATMGLNGFVALGGVPQDWATHMIGHELTALHGLSHGHTLAIVLPGTMNILRESKGDKIIQYGERVWGITEGTRDQRIDKTIAKTDEFFRSLGLTTRLSEEGIGMETIEEIERRFNERKVAFGENGNVNGEIAKKILMDRI